MNINEVILELYRLAETRKWRNKATNEALSLSAAIEGMEHIWELRLANKRRNAIANANKKGSFVKKLKSLLRMSVSRKAVPCSCDSAGINQVRKERQRQRLEKVAVSGCKILKSISCFLFYSYG